MIFAKPSFAAIFLFVDGFILIAGELFARKKPVAVEDEGLEDTEVSLRRSATATPRPSESSKRLRSSQVSAAPASPSSGASYVG